MSNFVIIKASSSNTDKEENNFRFDLDDIKSYRDSTGNYNTGIKNFSIIIYNKDNNYRHYYFVTDIERNEVLMKLDELLGAVNILNKTKNE